MRYVARRRVTKSACWGVEERNGGEEWYARAALVCVVGEGNEKRVR